MHELGLMDYVVRTVKKLVEEEDLHHVDKIVLEVGELSGTVPKFLYDCYAAVVDSTEFTNTELVLEMVKGVAYCNDCKKEYEMDINNLECPNCHGKNLTPISGKDLIIKEIQAR